MLKKAGIVVAAAAAGLLALSPLAFAGDKGHEDHHHKGEHSTSAGYDHSPNCSYEAAADNSVEQAGEGGDSLGVGGLVGNVAAPVNGQASAPVGSCNNVEDVVDVNIEDNVQDNSTTTSESSTDIDDSGNTTED